MKLLGKTSKCLAALASLTLFTGCSSSVGIDGVPLLEPSMPANPKCGAGSADIFKEVENSLSLTKMPDENLSLALFNNTSAEVTFGTVGYTEIYLVRDGIIVAASNATPEPWMEGPIAPGGTVAVNSLTAESCDKEKLAGTYEAYGLLKVDVFDAEGASKPIVASGGPWEITR